MAHALRSASALSAAGPGPRPPASADALADQAPRVSCLARQLHTAWSASARSRRRMRPAASASISVGESDGEVVTPRSDGVSPDPAHSDLHVIRLWQGDLGGTPDLEHRPCFADVSSPSQANDASSDDRNKAGGHADPLSAHASPVVQRSTDSRENVVRSNAANGQAAVVEAAAETSRESSSARASPEAAADAQPEAKPLAKKSGAKSRTLIRSLAAMRKRSRKPATQRTGPENQVEVDGYVIGPDSWMVHSFWVWGRWLYRDWLAQESRGVENLPLSSGAFFMASNHLSHLDCGATFMAAWAGGVKRVFALGARDYFFRSPWKAWFVTSFMSVIPFSRRGFSQQEIEVLLRVKETSGPDNPTAILIFPEGTRSTTGSLQDFKAGVGLLAEQLDIPVVPVCVKGTLDALPKGRTIPHRHKIRVEFGKALHFQDYMSLLPSDEHSTQAAPPSLAQPHGMLNPPAASVAAAGSHEMASKGETAADAAVLREPHAESPPDLGAGRDASTLRSQKAEHDKRAKREVHRRFAADLRASVSAMLGAYGQGPGRGAADHDGPVHRPPLAQRLGGGKWNLIGWLLYWLPMTCCLTVAVGLAASQVYRSGAMVGLPGAGALPLVSGGYAAVAGVFGNLPGAGQSLKVLVALSVLAVAFYLRVFINWLWPYVVLDCRED